MKATHWHRGLVAPILFSGPVLLHVLPASAQSDAVTQFAPLDDSPIPTPPSVGESNSGHSNAGQSNAPGPEAPNAAPSPTVSRDPTFYPPQGNSTSDAAWSNSKAPAAPTPMIGSSWLGAPVTPAPSPTHATRPVSQPPATVVDSGLPVFTTPASNSANRDVATDERSSQREQEDEETHRVAATFSLARAFLLPAVVPGDVKNAALYEGTVEIKVFERLSVAVLGGVGGFDVPFAELEENVHVTGKELGGQLRVYLLGDFDHGLSLGGEYLRVWAEADPIDVEAIPPPPLPPGTGVLTGEATLSGLGAFVGYKVTAWFGLTADAKLGIQKLTADGKGSVSGEIAPGYPTLTESETFHFEQLVPLVNVNVGWAI